MELGSNNKVIPENTTEARAFVAIKEAEITWREADIALACAMLSSSQDWPGCDTEGMMAKEAYRQICEGVIKGYQRDIDDFNMDIKEVKERFKL
uniref:Uncharacterized protein n=1 Tax=viral metagenome TaxID=1070528 RepID=A0A6M3LTC8_9ZZZZ